MIVCLLRDRAAEVVVFRSGRRPTTLCHIIMIRTTDGYWGKKTIVRYRKTKAPELNFPGIGSDFRVQIASPGKREPCNPNPNFR